MLTSILRRASRWMAPPLVAKQPHLSMCVPEWSEKELRHKCVDADTKPFDKPRGWLLAESDSRHEHGVAINGEKLFYTHVHLHGGPAPVRRYLPQLIDLVWSGKINPGKVFDLTLPLDQVAEGYRAMDERRAIKTLLRP